MALISEYEEQEESTQSRTSTPRHAKPSGPVQPPEIGQVPAVVSPPEEEPGTPPPSPAPAPSPPQSDEEVYNHDTALLALLEHHKRQPLGLLTTVVEFLFRETDLSREPGVSEIVTAAQKRRSAYEGEDVAQEKVPEVEATNSPKKEPKSPTETPYLTPRGGETVNSSDETTCKEKEPPAQKEPGTEHADFDSEGTGLPPNVGNGFDHENYSWTQSLGELTLHIRTPEGTKSKAVACEIKRNTLKAGVKGREPILQGELYQHVKVDDCFWSLDEDGTLSIYLTKFNQMKWWRSVVKGEPEINTRKVEPEKSRLDDLDAESRATAEKMMGLQYDQRQKALGLPSREESSKDDAIKKFMAHHPDMDFSKVRRG